MIKIIDINGKEREVKYIKKMSFDFENEDKSVITEDFSEVEICGNMRNWIEWYPWNEFIKRNPIYAGQ